ncbi:substrate-binding domain-containing protein [Niveibacterium sp. 24ML]|uniref:substrate-binding domain-containing protein n=1 Tax=Niveibacterium sp. 24ML TaxID=2985512 RepID=UPI00226FD066|nr:substrate-binding domain-containing protein [Niveibacterium sp. 24ML]MCX9158222.1 substrate-binding domain-containing protein [Niveibacterium sp. 24ML]
MMPIRRQLQKMALAAASLLAASAWAAEPGTKLDVIGISVSSLANPYFSALARGAQDRALEINPRVRVMSSASEYDVASQIREVEKFIADRVSLILIAASHPKDLGPVLMRAREAGISVVAVDVDTEGAEVMIQSDNRGAGEAVCRDLAVRLGGKGNLIIQNGPNVSSVIDRVEGCRAALRAYPDIRLLTDKGDGLASPWGGSKLMEEHLARYPQVDAVFAINDRQALGAETVARRAGLNRLLIGGVDGSPEVEVAMKRPGLIVVSAGQTPALIGQRAVDIGLALREGKPVEKRRILLPTPLLTRDNLGQYRGWEAR